MTSLDSSDVLEIYRGDGSGDDGIMETGQGRMQLLFQCMLLVGNGKHWHRVKREMVVEYKNSKKQNTTITHTHTRLMALFQEYRGKPVLER